jgi:predicted DNA-binding transcriptional regulator AlpA
MTQIQVFQLSVEDLSTMIRQSVATELQKVSNFISTTPKDDSDKILTRKEVCELFGVTEATLFNWNNEKILVNYKVGRRVYYKKSDVLAILNPLKEAS